MSVVIIYEIEPDTEVDPERPDRSRPLGTAASRDEARALISAFPGRGGFFLWDDETRRVVEIINSSNKRSSN